MSDTPLEVEVHLNALFANRSGSDRVWMACEMFDLARALVVANIRVGNPEVTGSELRAKIFERTYRDDFGPDELARIAARLRG